MKTEKQNVYVARDGTRFDKAADCRAHERAHDDAIFVGLTPDRIKAARTLTDKTLALAFERFGFQVTRARRATGDLIKKPRQHAAE